LPSTTFRETTERPRLEKSWMSEPTTLRVRLLEPPCFSWTLPPTRLPVTTTCLAFSACTLPPTRAPVATSVAPR
jgi:hypothetical protein